MARTWVRETGTFLRRLAGRLGELSSTLAAGEVSRRVSRRVRWERFADAGIMRMCLLQHAAADGGGSEQGEFGGAKPGKQ